MSYRPICDTWILARPKVKRFGSYPSGFLERARALIGCTYEESVLHVCGGAVRDYPFRGLGWRDKTLDLDPGVLPDFLQDARDPYPPAATIDDVQFLWEGILADPPYTPEEADHYAPGHAVFPTPGVILRRALDAVWVGGKVGILHRKAPRCPTNAKFVALVGVFMGFDNDARWFSVYERLPS